MGKKIPFLISTLITAASSLGALSFGVAPASAEQMSVDGTEYWSIDEVMVESENYLSEVAKCGGNDECKSSLEVAYLLAGGKYSAAAAFSNYYFLVTGINPSKSTITVYFNDKAAREYAFPKTDDLDVAKKLYMFWWENGEPEYGPRVFDGTTLDPNRQEIYTALAGAGEAILPGSVEHEIKLEGFDFTILEDHNLYYMVESEMSNSLTGRNYQSCMKEIHGLDDYECRVAMDDMGNTVAYPAAVKAAEADATDGGSDSQEEAKTEETPETLEGATEATNNESAQVVASTQSTPVISTSIIRVPEYIAVAQPSDTKDTQTNREDKEEAKLADSAESANALNNYNPDDYVEVPLAASNKSTEFPWWLLIFAFSGVAIVVFWFMLIRNKMSDD